MIWKQQSWTLTKRFIEDSLKKRDLAGTETGKFLLGLLFLGLTVNGFTATVDVYPMLSSSHATSGGFSTTNWGSRLGTVEAEASVYFVNSGQILYVNGATTEATFPAGVLYIGYQYDSSSQSPLSFSDSPGSFRVQSSLNADVVLGNAAMYMAYGGTPEGETFTLKGTLKIADGVSASLGANAQNKKWEISSAISGGVGSTLAISTRGTVNWMRLLHANNTFSGTWELATEDEAFLQANAVNTLGPDSTVSIRHAKANVQSGAAQTIQNLTISSGRYDSQGHNLTISGATTLNGNGLITATGGNQSLGTLTISGTMNHLSVANLYTNSVELKENSTLSIGKATFRLGSSMKVADTAKILLGYNRDGTLSSDSSVIAFNDAMTNHVINNLYLGNASIINAGENAKTLEGTLYVGGTSSLLRAASNSSESNRILTIASAISSESATAKGALYLISSNAPGSKVRLTGNNENFIGNLYVGKSDWSGGAQTIAEVVGNDSLGRGNVSVLSGSRLTSSGNQELQSLTLEENAELTILNGEWKITDSFTFLESSKVTMQLSNDAFTSLILPDGDLGGEIYLDSTENLDVNQTYSFLKTSDLDFNQIFLSESLQNAGFQVFYSGDGFSMGTFSNVPEPMTWSLLLSGMSWLLFQAVRRHKKGEFQ